MFFRRKIQVVTHSGSFHTDDVFAAAVFYLYFQKTKQKHELIRSVDPQVLAKADIVFDIGGIYDEDINRFDHHQKGGAGKRENGISYAAFGLVWKKYGTLLCNSKEISDIIDTVFVQAVDASDNGMNIFTRSIQGVSPVLIQDLIGSFNATYEEDEVKLTANFNQVLDIAIVYLERMIYQTKTQVSINKDIRSIYDSAEDKKLIVTGSLYGRVPLVNAVQDLSQVLYVVYPSKGDDGWNVCGARVSYDSFETRKPFPEEWRGLRDKDLENISGIQGATFCHNRGFLCVVQTKDQALSLAKKALGR